MPCTNLKSRSENEVALNIECYLSSHLEKEQIVHSLYCACIYRKHQALKFLNKNIASYADVADNIDSVTSYLRKLIQVAVTMIK